MPNENEDAIKVAEKKSPVTSPLMLLGKAAIKSGMKHGDLSLVRMGKALVTKAK